VAACLLKIKSKLKQFLLFLLWSCVGLCAPQGALAQEPGKAVGDSTALQLTIPLQWQALPKGAVQNPGDFNDPAKSAAFVNLVPQSVLPTTPEREVWLRFALPATAMVQSWYLRIPRVRLEQATLFYLDEQSRWMSQAAGENIAIASWPIPTRLPSFQLASRVDRVQTYYLKLEHRSAVTEHPELISPNKYLDDAVLAGSLVGLMVGLFSLLILLSLLTAYVYRNMHFVWFAIYVFLLLLLQLVMIGFAAHRLWPHSVYLNKTMIWIGALWALGACLWFIVQVSYAKEAFPRVYKISLGFMAVLVLTSIAYALNHHSFPNALLSGVTGLAMVWGLGCLGWMAWRSQRWLWLVAGGFAPLMLSMLTRLAYNFGWVRHIEITQVWSVVTSIVGMVIVYAGLILRNRELFAAMERKAAMAHTDAATGLTAAHIGAMRLPRMLVRSAHAQQPCAAILVQWLDYKKYIDPLPVAHQGVVLSHLGERLRHAARHIDTVVRLDEDQFLYLVESPISREAVNAMATKILTSCLRPALHLMQRDAYNVHIAAWVSSNITLTDAEVMEALRTRLNHMQHGTPRKVQFVQSPLSSGLGDTHREADSGLLNQDVLAKIDALEASAAAESIPKVKWEPI
jgi:two-component system, sensor histidine kinase LadS